ncbi:MAG: hypothetical protein K9N38_11375 [Candidatus Marinimicrobia bacterium]|nr:hypothetical protein [Candidatus Neomarinimicrobiota bacterium]MCF7851514.1 hypothetical protein [Candidatus Neomarinimicrobiota bacterium]
MGINIRRSYRSTKSHEQVLATFVGAAQKNYTDHILQVSNDLVMVKQRTRSSSWWSPELNLRVEQEGDGSRLYETIGPNASTFTLAMFMIIFGVVLFLVAVTWLVVQLQLGESSTLSFIGSIVSIIMVVSTWTILAYGRLKAREQVIKMRRFAGEIVSSF